MIKTEALIKTVLELAKENNKQYAEYCCKGMLKMRKITTDQYCKCISALYAQ